MTQTLYIDLGKKSKEEVAALLKKPRKEKHRFVIDFFEWSFLVQACVPPVPIARSMFWRNVIDKYYHELTRDERSRLFEWIGKDWAFIHSMTNNDPDCLLFHNRYNPDNQYLVTSVYKGKEQKHECFLHNDRYHISSTNSILEEFITKVEKSPVGE